MSHIQSEIIAHHVSSDIRLDAAQSASEWQSAQPVRFCADWQGQNPDPALETEVRILWSHTFLYLRFICRYRELFVFEDSESNGRRDHLWDRDVAEMFLQPHDQLALSDHGGPGVSAPAAEGVRPYAFYKEFEVAPNAMWIDLDVSPSGLAALNSGLIRSVNIDSQRKIWTAELAIPMRALTSHFDPDQPWRANFYRVEGTLEPRHYMAWQPTHTAQPNFHVPKVFGRLQFEKQKRA